MMRSTRIGNPLTTFITIGPLWIPFQNAEFFVRPSEPSDSFFVEKIESGHNVAAEKSLKTELTDMKRAMGVVQNIYAMGTVPYLPYSTGWGYCTVPRTYSKNMPGSRIE